MSEEQVKDAAKRVARFTIVALGLTLLVTIAATVVELYDFRILLGVMLGMTFGDSLLQLAKKIRGLD